MVVLARVYLQALCQRPLEIAWRRHAGGTDGHRHQRGSPHSAFIILEDDSLALNLVLSYLPDLCVPSLSVNALPFVIMVSSPPPMLQSWTKPTANFIGRSDLRVSKFVAAWGKVVVVLMTGAIEAYCGKRGPRKDECWIVRYKGNDESRFMRATVAARRRLGKL